MGAVLLLFLAALALLLWPWRLAGGGRTSLPGLIVLVLAAALLTVPLLPPGDRERAPPFPDRQLPPFPRAGEMPEPIVLPAEPDVIEIEPNNRLRQANQLSLGSVVAGTTSGGPDWYVVPLDLRPGSELELMLLLTQRHVRTGGIEATIFNARREFLDVARSGAGATYVRVPVGDNDRLYVRVEDYVFGPHDYELSARVVRD